MCQQYTIYDWHWDAPTLAKSAIGNVNPSNPIKPIKLHQTPPNSIKLHQTPPNSTNTHQDPSKPIKLHQTPPKPIKTVMYCNTHHAFPFHVQQSCLHENNFGPFGPAIIGHKCKILFVPPTGIIAAITYIVQGVLCIGKKKSNSNKTPPCYMYRPIVASLWHEWSDTVMRKSAWLIIEGEAVFAEKIQKKIFMTGFIVFGKARGSSWPDRPCRICRNTFACWKFSTRWPSSCLPVCWGSAVIWSTCWVYGGLSTRNTWTTLKDLYWWVTLAKQIIP